MERLVCLNQIAENGRFQRESQQMEEGSPPENKVRPGRSSLQSKQNQIFEIVSGRS
jgi:hypothetical protein